MAKNTKIYAEFMNDEVSANTNTITYSFGEKSFDVTLKTEMTVDDKSTFIDRVVKGCFDSNNEYRPEFKDAIFQITILQMLSDIPVFTKIMKELDENNNETENKIDVVDIDKTYSLCKKLNLFDKANDAFKELYNELLLLVEEKIRFEQKRIVAGERVILQKVKEDMEQGIALINGIANQLTEDLSKTIKDEGMLVMMNEFAKKYSNLTDAEILQKISSDK